jgi:hypothetical protein
MLPPEDVKWKCVGSFLPAKKKDEPVVFYNTRRKNNKED